MRLVFLCCLLASTAGVCMAQSTGAVTAQAARAGVVNVMDLGAKGDGVADDTAAIQAAINSFNPRVGGTVFFPGNRTFRCNSAINFDGRWGLKFVSEGNARSGLTPPTLLYTGAGAKFISLGSAKGIEFRNMHIAANNPAFAGDLVRAGRAPTSDAMQLTFSNCYFNGYNSNAGSLLHLNDSIIITVEACHFGYGRYAIVGIERFGQGVGFSNVVNITGCDFNTQRIAQIRNPGESWTISNCTFEPLANAPREARGRGRAVVQDAGVAYGLVFSGNWLGDYYQVGGNTHPVIRVGGYGLAFVGNRIQLPGDQTAIEITVSQGVTIAGNRIDGGRVGVSFTGGLTYGVEIGGGNDFQVQTPIAGEENIRQGMNADTTGYARLGNNGTPNFLDKLTIGGAPTDSIARSSLDVHGSFGTNSRLVTSRTYVVADDDHTLEIDASGGAVVVVLPVAATPRRELRFKRIDRTANLVTISGNGHNIDTEGLYYLNGFLKHLTIQSSATGAVWYIYASN